MSFETERYVSNRQDRIEELEREIKVLRMALIQHGDLIERLSEAESVIRIQVTDSAIAYRKKYNLRHIPFEPLQFEPCGKCLCKCFCEEENE